MAEEPPELPEPPAPPVPSPPGMELTTDNPLGMPMFDVEGGPGPAETSESGQTASSPGGVAEGASQYGQLFIQEWQKEMGDDVCEFCQLAMERLQEVEDPTKMAKGMAELAEAREFMQNNGDPSEDEVRELFNDWDVLDKVMSSIAAEL